MSSEEQAIGGAVQVWAGVLWGPMLPKSLWAELHLSKPQFHHLYNGSAMWSS